MAQDVLITSSNHLQPLSADHRMLHTREDTDMGQNWSRGTHSWIAVTVTKV